MTIDWERLEVQNGDAEPEFFSSLTTAVDRAAAPCHITRTTAETHRIVRADSHRSAVYSGAISGRGPRYCPSIEDKVIRFADRESHQIFLEPEGVDDSLDLSERHFDLASRRRRSALSSRRFPGSSARASFVPAMRSNMTISTRAASIRRWRRAGSAAYSLRARSTARPAMKRRPRRALLAGINAARKAGGRSLTTFDRAESYLGVMVDDLTTHGVTEPYRMFTSRAEFRLSLRADNADERLTAKGIALGCVGSERAQAFLRFKRRLEQARAMLHAATATPPVLEAHGLLVNHDGARRSAFELAAQSQFPISVLARVWPELAGIPANLVRRLEADAKYSVYLDRQAEDVARYRRDDAGGIAGRPRLRPPLRAIQRNSAEVRRGPPASLGQAGRIEGVTPAALALLAAHARRAARSSRAAGETRPET